MEPLSLREAIARHVRDGQSVALEGFTHLIPFAAGHEIIRQRRRELHLLRMTPDVISDQLIGMGCVRQLTFSWGGNPGVGSLHRLRDAVEHQWPSALSLIERTHGEMAVAYQAGASGLPCGLMRRGAQTDLATASAVRVRTVSCPFSGVALTAVPAINPDVTILHAQQVDAGGNVLIRGIVGAAKEAAMAARSLIVTVEEQVERLEADINSVVLPSWIVTAVSIVPGGAYPSYAHGYYARDNQLYQAWEAISRDRQSFNRWMQRHVIEAPGHEHHLKLLGVSA